jgi:hypothetical protein
MAEREVLMMSTILRFICAGVVLVAVTAGTPLAQPADKRTYFTFSGPVAIPGVTLPAGKYLFRLADTSSRNVVQILSADGKTPYAMFFIYRAERPEPPSNPEVRFMETAAGRPSAIHTWWYPGDRSGYEFVYPKEQARQLAKGTGQPVLATLAEVQPAPLAPAPEVARVSPAGQETPVSATVNRYCASDATGAHAPAEDGHRDAARGPCGRDPHLVCGADQKLAFCARVMSTTRRAARGVVFETEGVTGDDFQ